MAACGHKEKKNNQWLLKKFTVGFKKILLEWKYIRNEVRKS